MCSGSRRLRAGKPDQWVAFNFAQYATLVSLKPFFKAFVAVALLSLGWQLMRLGRAWWRPRARALAAAAVALTIACVALSQLVFRDSGKGPMALNKMLMIVTLLPEVSPDELASFSPDVRKTYLEMHEWKRVHPHGIGGLNDLSLTPESGAALYDAIYWRHLREWGGEFVSRMARLVRYSSWNENFGNIPEGLGLRHGFGSLGMIFTTAIVALVVTAVLLLSGAIPPLSEAMLLSLEDSALQLGLMAAYSFGVQMLFGHADVQRICFPWVIAWFVLLALGWSLVWPRVASKISRS